MFDFLRLAVLLCVVKIAEGVAVTLDPTTATWGTTVGAVVTAPTGSFTATDTLQVTTDAGCATVDAAATVSGLVVTGSMVTATVTLPSPGQRYVCYTETGNPVVAEGIAVTGPTGVTPAAYGLVSNAGDLVLAIAGTTLDPTNDDIKLVVGDNADCATSTAVDLCCTATPTKLTGTATQIDYTPSPLPYGGQFSVCYKAYEAARATFHQYLATLTVSGPTGFAPIIVPVGTFALTVEGFDLTSGAGGDRMMIASGNVCDDANVVASSDNLPLTNMKITFDVTILTPGVDYAVCYRVASRNMGTPASDLYYKMSNVLTVSGATSYSPTTAQGAGTVPVTFTGINLDSTSVGDSAKLVKGTDCLNGAAVMVGGIPGATQFTPTSVSGVTSLSLDVQVTEGGTFTMCYKSTHAGEYVPLSPVFEVAGAASFYPTVVPQFFVGSLVVTGALLNAGDAISIVPDGTACGDASAAALAWSVSTTTQGTATIASTSTLATSGDYRVCFTPFGGVEFMMPDPLVVSGAQSISPTTLIAGVSTVITVQGTNIGVTDLMKLVDQATEDCTPAFATHGTVVPSTAAGQFTVTVPYGGVFTLCYQLGGTTTYTASATVTVKGVRNLSPYAPVVAAVGTAVTFELEGSLLSSLDVVSIVEDTASGCSGTHIVPVPPLTVISTSLVSTGGTTFSSGGQFLMCYTVSGGPALPLNPLLSVKGPVDFTPTVVNFGESTALTFTGLALSTRDNFRLVDSGQNCADASVPLIPIATVGSVVITPAKGGTYFICYRPFEGGFVVMPDSVFVAGPTEVTPTSFYVNVETTVTLTGLGLTGGTADKVKLVDPSVGCAGAALFSSEQDMSATFTATFNATSIGTHHFCYQLQNATGGAYAYFATFTVMGVAAYTPTVIDVGYSSSLTLSGIGLDPTADRVLISSTSACPTATPDTTVPSYVTGTNTTLVYTTSLLEGGSDRAVCLWSNGAWVALSPLLTVLGPTSRTPVSTTTPYVAGSKLQFEIAGVGLNGGFDRVRWVKAPWVPGGATTCANPAVADTQVLAGSPILTPVVQLPGGTYIMCYALGPSGEFVPIGDPLGGALGGEVGEVELSGPSGFWVSAAQATAGQPLSLGFNNLVASATYVVRLCPNGDTTLPIPLDTGDEVSFADSLSMYPLLGGETQVCFSSAGSDYVALPLTVQGAAYNPTTPIDGPGVVVIRGPSSLSLPASSTSFTLDAGTQYDMTLAGTNLSLDSSVVRWAPSDVGCMDQTWLTNSLASQELVTATLLRTTFHVGGQFVLCYTYSGDTPQVHSLALPAITTAGMYRDVSVLIPLGQAGSTLVIPTNSSSPSADIWYWPQDTSADPVGVEACPTDPTLVAAAQKSTLLGVTGASASYNTSEINPGYLRVCATQGTSGTYYTLPYLVVVSGPVSFSPESVPSPGTYSVTFTGVNITDADKVRLVPQGDACNDAASSAYEKSLSSLAFTTQQFTTPAWYTMCYLMSGTGNVYKELATPFQVTGEAVGIQISSIVPTTVDSMQAFSVFAQVVDTSGAVVAQSGGTMDIATTTASPGVPTPLGTGLSQTVIDGKANFTIALGTAGVHTLMLSYVRGVQTFSTLSSDIFVVEGNVTAVAVTLSSTMFASGDTFSLSYQMVDVGYNALKVEDATVSLVLTALDAAASGGKVLGTTVGVTDINGQGVMDNLQIDRAGTYRLRVEAIADGVVYTSKDYDIIVDSGTGTELVISLQWAAGTEVTAGTLLAVDAYVEDWGNNTLYTTDPVTFYLRIGSDPAPPAGGVLYGTDPTLCSAQDTCQGVTGGVITQQGVANFRNVWLNKPGVYALEVVSPTLTGVTNTVVVRAGSANHLKVLEGSVQLSVDQVFALSVVVRDLAGNTLTNVADGTVTAIASTSASLAGTLSKVTTAGSAIFSDLRFGTAGTFTVRFTHQTLVLTGDSESLFVDVTFNTPVETLLYPVVHLNTPLAEFDAAAAKSVVAGLAGVQAGNVHIAATEGKDGGTLVYFQFVGVDDGNTAAVTLRDVLASNATAAASFQGGALLSSPYVTTRVSSDPTVVLTPSPPSGGSSLGSGEIVVIIIAILLFLVILAIILWWCMKSKSKKEKSRGNELGKEPADQDPDWQEGNQVGSRHGGYPGQQYQNENPLEQAPYNHKSPMRTPADPGAGFEMSRVIQTPVDQTPAAVEPVVDQPPVEDYHISHGGQPEPTASPPSPDYNVDPSPASPVGGGGGGGDPPLYHSNNAPNGTFNAR